MTAPNNLTKANYKDFLCILYMMIVHDEKPIRMGQLKLKRFNLYNKYFLLHEILLTKYRYSNILAVKMVNHSAEIIVNRVDL